MKFFEKMQFPCLNMSNFVKNLIIITLKNSFYESKRCDKWQKFKKMPTFFILGY